MTAGRKPIPTSLKQLHGNPGKRPLNDQEAKPPRVLPRAPKSLSPAAQKEWRRIAPLLFEQGLLTALDTTALMTYCTLYARWHDAETKVQEKGLLVKSPNGYPIVSPYVALANQLMRDMLKMLVEFGMTPASRSRVDITDDTPDPMDEYLRGRYARR